MRARLLRLVPQPRTRLQVAEQELLDVLRRAAETLDEREALAFYDFFAVLGGPLRAPGPSLEAADVNAIVALELVRAAGLCPARVRADRVVIRCPLPGHDDRRPSAAVLASGVLVCSVCGARDPFSWLVDAGLRPAEAVGLLVALGLRSDRRAELGSGPRSPIRSSSPPSETGPSQARLQGRRESHELSRAIGDRLAAAVAARQRVDRRLWELRALLPCVLDRAGVGLARADAFARFSRHVRAAAAEQRLSVPLRDAQGVGWSARY